jgi:phosphatidylserine/phosphatidylglycerophosphate/cardiolipin synthase-like enzyme
VIVAVSALVALAGTPAMANGSKQSSTTTAGVTASTSVGAKQSSQASAAPSAKHKKKRWPKAPDHFTPRTGVRFNEPYNRDGHRQGQIRSQILRSINSTVHGDTIRASTWNFRGWPYVDALSNAAKRGVVVRVLIAQGNSPAEVKNPMARSLKARLHTTSQRLKPRGVPASWLRWCDGSCRGFGGILHTKMVLFDHIGDRTNNVVMYGSNNLTSTAVSNQWNDWFTLARNADSFDFFAKVFKQMTRDHHVAGGAYLERKIGNGPASLPLYDMSVYPYTGKKANGDPILRVLNKVRCTGATNVPGGHTQLRIGQDALAGQRGMNIGSKLATMERRGCNIKLVYTLLGGNVQKTLTGAGVKLTHMAYDANRDGAYDHYLHMKVMAIKGVFGNDKSALVATNGTANWTALPLHSDEIASVISARPIVRSYFGWLDWLAGHRPAGWVPPDLAPTTTTGVTTDGGDTNTDGGLDGRKIVPFSPSDPYRLIRADL